MPLYNPLFSGSLTRLLDGSSYLVAGTNVTIITQSNGQVFISATGGAGSSGSNQPWVDGNDKIKTSGSVSIDDDDHFATDYGTDVFFFVSGSKNIAAGANRHVSVFGGDVVVSGSVSGSSSVLLQDEGISRGASYVFNFVGAGVTTTLTNGTASINIPGGAGASWTEIEIDFGPLPRYVVTSSIADGTVSATSKINIWQAGIAPTGKTADENEMDGLICNAFPGTGTFDLRAFAVPGPVSGKYVFWYTVQ